MNYIPKYFEILGQKINVDLEPTLMNSSDAYGSANYRENSITIQTPTESCSIPDDKIMQVYFHEAVHWILFMMGRVELNHDEEFVDLFSHLLYQITKTSQGVAYETKSRYSRITNTNSEEGRICNTPFSGHFQPYTPTLESTTLSTTG